MTTLISEFMKADVNDVIKGLGHLGHALEDKTILISGARGYLGRFIVQTLLGLNERLTKPCHIIAMDTELLEPNDKRLEWRNVPNLVYKQHDVRFGFGIESVTSRKIDYVMHLAGIASPIWYERYPLDTIAVAVDGSKTMLGIAQQHGAKYLFTSSSEVYQTPTVVPTPETYVGAIPTMTKRSCYDVSKALGETLVFIFAEAGVNANAVRIFNSFGVGMRQGDQRILTRIADAMVKGEKVKVYHQKNAPTRTYTPVANTVFGVFLALLKGEQGEIYNVGLDSPELSVKALCERVEHVTGQVVRQERQKPPAVYTTEPLRRCPDITKLKKLGFLPIVDLDKGLERFFDWALQMYTK